MKFYFQGGLWDGQANKVFARATDGVFETEDPKLIAKLKAMGISTEPKPVKNKPTPHLEQPTPPKKEEEIAEGITTEQAKKAAANTRSKRKKQEMK